MNRFAAPSLPLSGRRSPTGARRRAALLLEVILALAILFMGMAVIGIQLSSALQIGYRSERSSQALMLGEAKLAQLDSGGIDLQRELGADGIMEGDFGITFPGYFWRFLLEPDENVADLFTVRLEILYGTPEDDLEPGSIEDAKRVITLHALRPTPATLNLQRDFGFSDEELEEVAASLPVDIDPTDLSPAALANRDPAELLELMPTLLEIFGQGFGFSPEQIQQAMNSGMLGNLPAGLNPFEGAADGGRGTGDGAGAGEDGGPPSLESVLESVGGKVGAGGGRDRGRGTGDDDTDNQGRGPGRGGR